MVINIFQTAGNDQISNQARDSFRRRKLAVLDTETTGVLRGRDRVIEIAILHCDDEGNIEDEYITLINPNRDLGPTTIHGIRASDVINAPQFSEIAGDILERLHKRVVVGHNVQFDLGMLSGEYERLKTVMPEPHSVCTLRLAYKFGPKSRKLAQCCSHFGIDHTNGHNALDDAKVTIQLFVRYLALAQLDGLESLLHLHGFSHGVEDSHWPSMPTSGKKFCRTAGDDHRVHPFLATLLSKLPDPGTADAAAYFSLLDRALEDRKLSEAEISELSNVAIEAGISPTALTQAHQEYLRGLIATAYQDRILSDAEKQDIDLVGRLLGFDQEYVTQAIEVVLATGKDEGVVQQDRNNQLSGKTVCFTGTMTCKIDGEPISRSLAEKLAKDKGLIPVPGVTKKTEILVIADPDSLSGKAKKARDYNTRIIADRVFWNLLGVSTE